MAPEVSEKQPHDGLCDWWSFGVMLHEMLLGFRPNFTDDWQTDFHGSLVSSAKNLLKGLWVIEPGQRISARGGASAVKNTSFFKGVSFEDHMNGRIRPPSTYNPARGALGN